MTTHEIIHSVVFPIILGIAGMTDGIVYAVRPSRLLKDWVIEAIAARNKNPYTFLSLTCILHFSAGGVLIISGICSALLPDWLLYIDITTGSLLIIALILILYRNRAYLGRWRMVK